MEISLGLFQNYYFPHTLAKTRGIFFSYIYCEDGVCPENKTKESAKLPGTTVG